MYITVSMFHIALHNLPLYLYFILGICCDLICVVFSPITLWTNSDDEICLHIPQFITVFSEEDRKAMQTLFSYKP